MLSCPYHTKLHSKGRTLNTHQCHQYLPPKPAEKTSTLLTKLATALRANGLELLLSISPNEDLLQLHYHSSFALCLDLLPDSSIGSFSSIKPV